MASEFFVLYRVYFPIHKILISTPFFLELIHMFYVPRLIFTVAKKKICFLFGVSTACALWLINFSFPKSSDIKRSTFNVFRPYVICWNIGEWGGQVNSSGWASKCLFTLWFVYIQVVVSSGIIWEEILSLCMCF